MATKTDIFVDREARHPGRVSIVPINGGSYVADIVRADDPINEGTLLEAELLNQLAVWQDVVSQFVEKTQLGEATITIQLNSNTVGSFNANASSNRTLNIVITKSDVGLSNVDNVKQVPATRTVNGKELSSNITLTKADVGLSEVDNVKLVPQTRTVNSKALSSNITLTKADVGLGNVDNVKQVPSTRTVNGKELSADITLAKGDVGLGNVDNNKQMPIAGGTFTGTATAKTEAKAGTFLRNARVTAKDESTNVSTDHLLFARK